METTPNTSNVEPIESLVDPVSSEGIGSEGATDTKSSADSDKTESFDAWLKRHEESKAKEPKNNRSDEKKAEIPSSAKEIESKETKSKENVGKDSKTEQIDTRSPQTTEPVVKVGDKEYKAQDIEQLSKSVEQFKAKEAETMKEIEAFVNTLKTNPGQALDKLGVGRDLIEKYYYEKYIEPETLTAEQKLERLQGSIKQKEETEAKAKAEAEETARIERNRTYWKEKINEALTSEGVPQTEWSVNRMAGYIQQAKVKGIQVSNQDLAKLVKEDMETAQLNAVKGLTPEQLVKALGEEGAKKFRQYQTEQFKQNKFENKNPSTTKVETKKKEAKKYSSPYDMLDDI